jgi:serine/threonine-protein kinase
MGVVYKARQLKPPRLVALKMVLAGGHAGTEKVARFRTEVEAVARLAHPNVVQVYEVGEHQGLPFFSMELCPGGLDRKLGGTPQPARDAARLVEALARGVHAAHQGLVVHRDLKPANVLLSADGTPKVSDFGLAKKLDEAGQTRTGAVVGTPSYMAPEQAAGKSKTVGPAADVYALGAILYECLTGRPPFKAASDWETVVQVLSAEPVPPRRLSPKVPRDLETVCLKCLRKEPDRRYASAAELADDLGRFLRGEPVLARPVGPAGRLARWARRRPAVAGLLLALLVLSAAGIAAWVSAANARTQQALREKRLTEEAEDTLAESWLRPLGDGGEELTRGEQEAFRELAASESERAWLRFFEIGLERPETAARLGRRSAMAVQAGVGSSRERQERLVQLLRNKLRDGQAGREVREACVYLGMALEARDEAFCGELMNAAVRVMAEVTDSYARDRLASAVAALAARLGPHEALDALAKATKATDPHALSALAGAVVGLAARMGPAEAAAAAGKALDALAKATDPHARASLASAVAALATRLGPAEAAAAAGKALDALAKATDPHARARSFLTIRVRGPPDSCGGGIEY